MTDGFQTDSGEDDASIELFRELVCYSDDSDLQAPIRPGDALHKAIVNYKHSLPSGHLPIVDQMRMRKLLDFSRSKLLDERRSSQDIAENWANTLYSRSPAVRREYPDQSRENEPELTLERFESWLCESLRVNRSFSNSKSSSESSSVSSEKVSDRLEKPKRPRTNANQPSGANLRLIAALTKHHGYENGSVVTYEPIGCNKLGSLAGVSGKAASNFFKKHFKNHNAYRQLCSQRENLVSALKLLNGEYTPKIFVSGLRSNESVSEDIDCD